MTERAPDVRFDFYLVPHGYQVDTFVAGKRIASTVRDYSGSAESEEKHVQILLEEISDALERLRSRVR